MELQQRKRITKCALFGLITYLLCMTGAFFRLGGGMYLHVGDAAVYGAALVLPLPDALIAAVVGCAAADLTLGSAMYLLPTVILKSLTVLAIKGLLRLTDREPLQDGLICLSGAVITVAGYFCADLILSNVGGAAENSLFELVQGGAAAVLYLLCAGSLRKRFNK